MKFRKGNIRASKLTASEVFAMREAYARGATQGELCRRYRLSVGQVGRIVRGESWSEYSNPAVEDEGPVRTAPADDDEIARLAAESLRQLQNKMAAENAPAEQFISDRKEDLEEEITAERQEQLLRRLNADAGKNPSSALEQFATKESDK